MDFLLPCLDPASFDLPGSGSLNLDGWLESLLQDFLAKRSPESEFDLTRLCNIAIDRKSKKSWGNSIPSGDRELGTIIQAALQLRDSTILKSALPLVKGKLRQEVFKHIGACLPTFSWSDWEEEWVSLRLAGPCSC